MSGGADNIHFLDMGHNCHKDVLAFQWNNLDFVVDVIDGSIIKRDTVECLVPIISQVDFPDRHQVWRDLEEFVSSSG